MALQVSVPSIEMLRFLNRNHHHYCSTSKTNFFLGFRFLQYPSLKLYSNVSNSTTQTSITQDYLVNICGLSPELALSAAQKVRLSSTEKPNSVLYLFQNNGFSKTQITKIISKYPSLLAVDLEILKPKIDFFQNLGILGPQLTKLICSDPTLLRGGLTTHLIPSVEYLKRFLRNDEEVGIVFRKYTLVFRYNLEKVMGPNIAILLDIGIPRANISKLLLCNPSVLTTKTVRFNEIANVLKEMGFNPSSMAFIRAIRVMAGMNDENLKRKMSLYKELGWSEREVLLMFKKQPSCMDASEERIRKGADFFLNKLKWQVSDLCLNPSIFLLSLEKRIIPRCSVLGVLISKGVLRRFGLKWALYMNEKEFLEKYVVGYQEKIPDVLKAYEGEIEFEGFGEAMC